MYVQRETLTHEKNQIFFLDENYEAVKEICYYENDRPSRVTTKEEGDNMQLIKVKY